MDLVVINDCIRCAFEHEAEQKMMKEYFAFAPFASLKGNNVSFDQFKNIKPSRKGTDNDIDSIRQHFGL